MEINPQHIITTNYDELIEKSSSFKNDFYDVIYDDESLYSSNYNHHIIKMHGDINHLETIVLKEKDYLDYSDHHKLIETFIKALMVDHFFVFCGYSINDYNVKMMINWFNNIHKESNRMFGYILLDSVDEKDSLYLSQKGLKVIDVHDCHKFEIPSPLTNVKGMNVYNFLYLLKHNEYDAKLFPSEYSKSIDDELQSLKYTNVRSLMLNYGIKASREAGILVVSEGMQVIDCLMTNSKEFPKLLYKNRIICIQDIYQHTKHIINPSDRFEGIKFIEYGYLNDYELVFDSVDNSFSKKYYADEISSIFVHSNYNNNYSSIECFNELEVYIRKFNDSLNSFNTNNDITKIKKEMHDYIEINNLHYFLDMFIDVASYTSICSDYLNKIESHLNEMNTYYTYGGDYHHFYNLQNIAYDYYLISRIHGVKTFDGNLKKIYSSYFNAVCLYSSIYFDNINYPKLLRVEKYKLDYIDIDIICKNIEPREIIKILKSSKVEKFETKNVDFDLLINNYIKSFNNIDGFRNFNILISYMILVYKSNYILKPETKRNIIEFLVKNKNWIENPVINKTLLYALDGILDDTVNSFEFIKFVTESKEYNSLLINMDIDSLKSLFTKLFNTKDTKFLLKKLQSLQEEYTNSNTKVYYEIYIYYDLLKKTNVGDLENLNTFLRQNVLNIPDLLLQNYVYTNIVEFDYIIANNLIEYIRVKKVTNNFHVVPDPVQEKIELLIYYSLNGKISNYSIFEPIIDKSDYLKFLYNPDIFDWKKINFSNDFWNDIFLKIVSKDLIDKHYKELEENILENKKISCMSEYETYLYYKYFYNNL